jgi:GT2 family glycosyltransferase
MSGNIDNNNLPLVCAVVPAFNRASCTLRFLKEFQKVSYPNKTVVIVDDGSTDHTSELIWAQFKDTHIIHGDGNLWWAGGTNAGIRYALKELKTDYILTINDDVVMEENFLTYMVETALRDPMYIVGCCLFTQHDTDQIWSIGTRVTCRFRRLFELNFIDQSWEKVKGKLPDPYPVDTMSGNGVLLPRSVFENIGYYEEKYMPQYHADSDLVLRVRKKTGYKPVISLKSHLYNQIITEPLVNNRWDLVFSKKSDLYLPSIWTNIVRYGQFPFRLTNLFFIYFEFFIPHFMKQLLGRAVSPFRKRGKYDH